MTLPHFSLSPNIDFGSKNKIRGAHFLLQHYQTNIGGDGVDNLVGEWTPVKYIGSAGASGGDKHRLKLVHYCFVLVSHLICGGIWCLGSDYPEAGRGCYH